MDRIKITVPRLNDAQSEALYKGAHKIGIKVIILRSSNNDSIIIKNRWNYARFIAFSDLLQDIVETQNSP